LELKVTNRTNQLSASREQYRLLVETTKTIPFELGISDLCFRYMGPQAQTMLGVTSADALAPGFLESNLHPDDRDKTVAALAAMSDEAAAQIDIELRIRRRDGGYTWVRLIASVAAGLKAADDQGASDDAVLFRSFLGRDFPPESPAPGRTLRGVLFDVSQTHELELQLRQAQKLESVGRLASGVAHEINTPVQFVSDNVHFLKGAFGDLAGVLQKYQSLRAAVVEGTASTQMAEDIGQAEDAADLTYVLESAPSALDRSIDGLGRIAGIVRSMKDFAHPDQKEMAAIDLNQALSSTLTIARNEYKYVAEIETDFGDIPPVTCHAGEVNQVFLNIIVNAAHAIGDVVQGSDRRGRITVTSRHEGPDVIVSISDTGGGIPDHLRDQIFDPFFTTKPVGKGTGQGLAIARSVVVDKHGGEIRVETAVGKGTTFFVRLPIERRGDQIAA
jgi:PAS domain S-box-containing protein